MNNKEYFDFIRKNVQACDTTAEQRIERLVNMLIDALYVPVKGFNQLSKKDTLRTYPAGIDDNEPINWGALGCASVEKMDGEKWLVTLEEAAPNDCPTLCSYIQEYMISYGWDIKVQTEW